jgi:hypothetical protein
MTDVCAELERRADQISKRYGVLAEVLLMRALALALRNGGGCGCHGEDNGAPCPEHCHGTGIADAMRELLHSLGVEVA